MSEAPLPAKAANILPAICVSRLQEAAAIQDPKERRLAVHVATRFAKLSYPNYFKDEDHGYQAK